MPHLDASAYSRMVVRRLTGPLDKVFNYAFEVTLPIEVLEGYLDEQRNFTSSHFLDILLSSFLVLTYSVMGSSLFDFDVSLSVHGGDSFLITWHSTGTFKSRLTWSLTATMLYVLKDNLYY